MSGSGRPLRFLAIVLAGWVGVRVLLSWPDDGATTPRVRIAKQPHTATLPLDPQPVAAILQPSDRQRTPVRLMLTMIDRSPSIPFSAARPGGRVPLLSDMPPEGIDGIATSGSVPLLSPPVAAMPARARTTVSLWGMARPGAATGGPVQLGGGQAGVRVRIPIAANGRIALATRLAAPLAGQGREVAVGAEWRPVDGVAMVLERRIALDRSGSGTGLGMIAGIDRRDVIAGFDLEAYGQAGAVARDGIEPYADGAVRGVAPVATMRGAVVRLGLGGWGGAQRGAARLDVGPSLTVGMPVGRDSSMRLSVDWRQRVAGNAAPGSGPAVTLGGDF